MSDVCTIPRREFITSMHSEQLAALRAFDRGSRRFYMRWHRRARKTTLWVNILIREAIRHPNRVYLFIAPTYKQGKAIVWSDPNMLFKWLPPQSQVAWTKNEQELSITFPNGSVIRVVGGDNPDSVRGIDCWGAVFDEWGVGDIKPSIYTEIIRPIIAQDPLRWVAFIFTPKGQNHAFEMDMRVCDDPDWYYQLLTADQSGLIPPAELAKAKAELPTAVYDQEFGCSYITDEDRALISSAMLDRLKSIHFAETRVKKIISCDPAMGGDACPIMAFENTRVVDKRVIHSRLEGEIVGELLAMSNSHECDDFVIDSIGIGAGIAQRVAESGKRVQMFVSSAKSSAPEKFRHLKDEAWWYARQEVQACRVVYPDDIQIRREVSSVKFTRFDATGVMHLEPKSKTKEELQHSPDHADAWVMGLWGLRNVDDGLAGAKGYRDEDQSIYAARGGGMAA